MKNWIRFTVVGFLAALFLSSCLIVPYSYIPQVGSPRKVENGVYTVSIDKSFNEEERKFVINRFVRFMSYESYDYELTIPADKSTGFDVFTVTIPGSIPVEDLPAVKKWDVEVWALDHF